MTLFNVGHDAVRAANGAPGLRFLLYRRQAEAGPHRNNIDRQECFLPAFPRGLRRRPQRRSLGNLRIWADRLHRGFLMACGDEPATVHGAYGRWFIRHAAGQRGIGI